MEDGKKCKMFLLIILYSKMVKEKFNTISVINYYGMVEQVGQFLWNVSKVFFIVLILVK